MILEPKKIKSATASIFFPIYLPRSDVGLGLQNSSHLLPNGQTLGNNSLWLILDCPSGQQQKLNREGMWKGVHTPNAERNVHEHLLSSGWSHQNHLLFLQFPMKSRIRSNKGHGQALGFWSQSHLCYLAMGSTSQSYSFLLCKGGLKPFPSSHSRFEN